jgi:putative PEP-CTERM system histidine kinase
MNVIGVSSYLSGAAMFLLFSGLLLTSWRGRLAGALMVAACLASTGWAAFFAYAAWVGSVALPWVFTVEILRDAAWLALLLNLMGALHGLVVPRGMRLTVHAVWIGLLVYVLVSSGVPVLVEPHRWPVGVPVIGLLALAVIGLVLIEQLYRNTPLTKRWALKFLCIGLGAMFAYDLFLYSYVLLFHLVSRSLWDARGVINALIVPLLAISAARNPTWSVEVHVSRRIVFYSASLLGAGLYLLAMALGGYYIRLYGGDWGTLAATVFIFAGCIFLLMLLFSGQVRGTLRVFLSKHFFNYRYDYREEWLRLIGTLAGAKLDLPLPQRCVMALAEITDSPVGLLWMRDEAGAFRAHTRWNMAFPEQEIEAADSLLIEFLGQGTWVIDLEDYWRDPADYAGLELPDWLAALPRAWAVVPLMQGETLAGFMVLGKPRAPRRLNWEDSDLLLTVGRQIAAHLGQHESARQLAEARQFEGYNRLTAFVMHDLKNIIAQQALIVNNASKHKTNPAFVDDAIATVANSVRRMRHLLDQLTRGETPANSATIRVNELIERVLAECEGGQPAPQLALADERLAVRVPVERIVSSLAHVLGNAQDAAGPAGHVSIGAHGEAGIARIEVRDDGPGMDAEFIREHLFRPFFTTKASKGMGIGAYQAREYVQAAGGSVEVASDPGQGTCFVIRLPAACVSMDETSPKRIGIAQ